MEGSGGNGNLKPLGLKISGTGSARPATSNEMELIKAAEKDKITSSPENSLQEFTNDAPVPEKKEESEGGVEKSQADGEPMMLKGSSKKDFDQALIADARSATSNDDGGITRGITKEGNESDGMVFQPPAKMNDDSKINKYELSGFTIQYKTPAGTDRVEDIREYFDTIDEAVKHVTGGVYVMNIPEGSITAKIIRGAPTICFNERQVKECINGLWR